jgi:hypothetical protein
MKTCTQEFKCVYCCRLDFVIIQSIAPSWCCERTACVLHCLFVLHVGTKCGTYDTGMVMSLGRVVICHSWYMYNYVRSVEGGMYVYDVSAAVEYYVCRERGRDRE